MTPQPTTPETLASTLLDLIGALVRETRTQGATTVVTLDSRLERDLGLDSLSRTELLLRCEQAFAVSLPETALTAETPRDLLRWLLEAHGSPEPAAASEWPTLAPGVPVPPPAAATTLLEVLDWHAHTQPERTYLYLYGKDDQDLTTLSFQALREGAREVAAGLRHRGLQPQQTVAIMLPTSLDYLYSFFGALLAGAVPVPIYPPVRPSQLEDHLRRHSRILSSAQTPILITIPEARTVARLLKAQVDALRHVVTVDELRQLAPDWRNPPVRSEDLAFLQYTSGSTGDPKGVMLTHANLLANLRTIGERIQVVADDVFVSWLPLYHDMGLIGACIGTLYFGVPLVLMSPLSFMARPSRWLWAIHRHRGTLSAAPNFAYELCLRAAGEQQLHGLDLSGWRMTLNGAEPVNPDTVDRFIARFSEYGFRAEAMAPVYGLAESSVGLALQPPDRVPRVDRICREPFVTSGQAVPAADDEVEGVLRFVSCGQPLAGHAVRIVGGDGEELPERQEGRLEFRGPSCTSGYYRNPEATRRLFHDGWLDSGDRAYRVGDDLFITGRVKELIIRGGRNLYPYELEAAVGRVAGVRRGNVAVFASRNPVGATERLVVVAESRVPAAQREALRQQIQAVTVDLLGTPADDVVLAPPYTVLKTSSGKIRRTALRELYEKGTLTQGRRAVWWQLTRLALAAVGPQLRRGWRRLTDGLYAVHAWSMFWVLAPGVWLLLTLLPRPSQCWAVARHSVRLLFALTGTPLKVEGLEHLPRDRPCVVVVNHTSYLDSLVLAAALPNDYRYVAKRELLDQPMTGLPLSRLGTLFVERSDAQRSASEGHTIAAEVAAGHSLAYFPEGTFGYVPGLLPFRMGAFVAAARAGVPVVPVALSGTRAILPAGSWRPRRGRLRVVVLPAIAPTGSDWVAAVRLRDAARAAILAECGEPDRG